MFHLYDACAVMYWLVIISTFVASQPVHHQYDADHDEYPYVVSIQGRSPHTQPAGALQRICSGSLISETWVLTAAHCLVAHAVTIRYGDPSMQRNMSAYSRILRTVLHPGYNVLPMPRTTFGHVLHASNDIGLIFVEKVKLRGLAQLSSVDYKSLYGMVVTYAGYGDKPMQKTGLRQTEEHLQSSEGVVGPCKSDDRSWRKLDLCVVQKCAVRDENRYTGELGGPLLHEGKIVGVCVDTLQLRLVGFIPVSPYLEWLYDIVNGTVR